MMAMHSFVLSSVRCAARKPCSPVLHSSLSARNPDRVYVGFLCRMSFRLLSSSLRFPSEYSIWSVKKRITAKSECQGSSYESQQEIWLNT